MSILNEWNRRMAEGLRNDLHRLNRTPPARTGPRTLIEDDMDAFMRAAEERPERPVLHLSRPRVAPGTRQQFINNVRLRYPMRLRRLERDLRWLRRQAQKAGLDPEEVRWML